MHLLASGPAGDLLWVRGFRTGGVAEPRGLVVDAEGAVCVTGYFVGSLDLGGDRAPLNGGRSGGPPAHWTTLDQRLVSPLSKSS